MSDVAASLRSAPTPRIEYRRFDARVPLPKDVLAAVVFGDAPPQHDPRCVRVGLTPLRGAGLIAHALEHAVGRERAQGLALGSLLCAYAVDSALFGLHHVVCQSLVRIMGLPHAETNATMLPHTMSAMRSRAPEAIEALCEALGTKPSYLGRKITKLGGGARSLGDLGADRERLDDAVKAILARPELGMTPDPPDADDVRALIDRAW